MNSYHERTLALLTDQAKTLQSSSIGRSFDLRDEEDCQAFAEWFLNTAEELGMTLVPMWPLLTDIDREKVDAYTHDELDAIAQFTRRME